MPAGPLREPIAPALKRASAVVMIGASEQRLDVGRLPILEAGLVPINADPFKGQRVFAFAGIGRPAKFFATLRALGADIVWTRAFPDHHAFGNSELVALEAAALAKNAALVTTEKDWVRLPASWQGKIRALKVELRWDDTAALERVLAPALKAAHG
jgi:tetraacyldisaccharide 4'-kinase